ncbi:MAG: PIN domain-containing protein [Trueperaceae bacterium]|nr:MAG: PIN domain-containing protein [Trueperaceae bacterium]
MTALLDANALIALVVRDHVHHDLMGRWWRSWQGGYVTTPSTQASLLRFLVREGSGIATATAVLDGMTRHPRHTFWPDALPYREVDLGRVMGHRQVTDAYLAASARAHGGSVVTLDRGFAAAHPDVAVLLRPA